VHWQEIREHWYIVAELHHYKAIILDLFDTIVTWNPEGLPLVKWRDRETWSTAPLMFDVLETAFGAPIDRDAFLDTQFEVLREIYEARTEHEPLEITCLERMTRTVRKFGAEEKIAATLAEELRQIHMGGVRQVTSAPAPRVEAVRKLATKYRLGLVSNFDDGETGHLIVADTGVRELFEVVVISADAGLRKPHPQIFLDTIARMGLEPHDVLYVGDTAHDDVLGSKRVGMHSAWINKRGEPLPEGIPAPDIIISDLAELPERLGI
jgi:HAD superfamily hydrolase (TIGR01549 family)